MASVHWIIHNLAHPTGHVCWLVESNDRMTEPSRTTNGKRHDNRPRNTTTKAKDLMKILFLHGWTSVPGGTKPTFLKEHGHTVINPTLPDDDFDEAVRIAQAKFDKHRPHVIVGSSRGGAVAMNIESGDIPLVLLCPGWKKWGTATTVKPNTTVLHSRADDVVPFADTKELLANSGLPTEALIEVGSDHRLAEPMPLQAMLDACERAVIV